MVLIMSQNQQSLLFLFFTGVVLYSTTHAQEFVPSEIYQVNQINKEFIDLNSVNNIEGKRVVPIYLFKNKDTISKVFDIYVEDIKAPYYEVYHECEGVDVLDCVDAEENLVDVEVAVNNEVDIKDVKNVILVKSLFTFCCESSHLKYFIETNKGEYFQLPELENIDCDEGLPFKEYRFPNQKFGMENKILLGVSYLNEDFEVDSYEIEKRFLWKGNFLFVEE